MNVHDLPKRFQDQVAAQLYPRGGASPSLVEHGSENRPLEARLSEEENPSIYQIRVVSFRVRLCDEDNLCEKFHIDALRYAGVIPDDAPDRCHIVTTQKKVATKKEERTEITITRPQ